MGNDASAGRLWLWWFALGAFGVLGLVVFAANMMTDPERDEACDSVLVEEAIGSRGEVLPLAKKYLYAPGDDFSNRESARIGAASQHYGRRLDPQPGEELPGTQLPKAPAAIGQALDGLAAEQHVHWSWERREEGVPYPARHVLVARTDDATYHVRVEDIACGPSGTSDGPRAPH